MDVHVITSLDPIPQRELDKDPKKNAAARSCKIKIQPVSNSLLPDPLTDKRLITRYRFSGNNQPPVELYGFTGAMQENETYYMAQMPIKPYFKEVQPGLTDFNALFLIYLGPYKTVKHDRIDKARGQFGCPLRIVMDTQTTKEKRTPFTSFEFNGMNFYPFLLREFTVCYYVCDKHSREYDWKRKYGDEFYNMYSVGVNHPIQYDATLGLFVTRSAELKPRQSKK
jgi:hypothetical protein